MTGFAFGLAAAFFVASVLLFIRLQGAKDGARRAAEGAEACADELEAEQSRKRAQLDDYEQEITALTDRLVACRDPSLIRSWLDDALARVRERHEGDPDRPGPGAGATGAGASRGQDDP